MDESFDDRAIAAAYDSLAAVYDDSYPQKKSVAENTLILSFLRTLISPRAVTLDLGCGTGFLLDHVAIEPSHYSGVDLSPKMIGRARAKHPGHFFHVGSMEHLSMIDSESCDAAVSLFGAFSYARRPGRAASEIRRCLKPGGRFLVMAYGRRYPSRESYILNHMGIRLNAILYGTRDLKRVFNGFRDVTVTGLSLAVDSLPELMPQALFNLWLRIERAMAGRLLANQHYFLIATGTK